VPVKKKTKKKNNKKKRKIKKNRVPIIPSQDNLEMAFNKDDGVSILPKKSVTGYGMGQDLASKRDAQYNHPWDR
jgi:hypothetical protein